jgi:hypothetical protein
MEAGTGRNQKQMNAVSPEGDEIIGTLEIVEGTSCADVSLSKNGRLKVDYCGETDVDWNSQRTKTDNGERLFVCSRHKVWRESQVLEATKARRGKESGPRRRG